MKVAIRYNEHELNTKKLAFAIQDELGIAAETIDIPVVSEVDLLFLGSSIYKGEEANEIKEFISKMKGRKIKVISFSSTPFQKRNHCFLNQQLHLAKLVLLPESYNFGNIMTIFHKCQPNDEDLNNIKSFSKEVIRKYLK